MRAMFDFHSDVVLLPGLMHEEDKPKLFEIIGKYEGEEAVRWAKK